MAKQNNLRSKEPSLLLVAELSQDMYDLWFKIEHKQVTLEWNQCPDYIMQCRQRNRISTVGVHCVVHDRYFQ